MPVSPSGNILLGQLVHDTTSDYSAVALELREFLLISKQPESRSVLMALAVMYEKLAGRPRVPANTNEPEDDSPYAN